MKSHKNSCLSQTFTDHFVTEFSKCHNMSQNFRQARFVTESHHVTGNHISVIYFPLETVLFITNVTSLVWIWFVYVKITFDVIAFFRDIMSIPRLTHLDCYNSLCHGRSLTFKFLNYAMGNKSDTQYPLDTRNYRLSVPHDWQH